MSALAFVNSAVHNVARALFLQWYYSLISDAATGRVYSLGFGGFRRDNKAGGWIKVKGLYGAPSQKELMHRMQSCAPDMPGCSGPVAAAATAAAAEVAASDAEAEAQFLFSPEDGAGVGLGADVDPSGIDPSGGMLSLPGVQQYQQQQAHHGYAPKMPEEWLPFEALSYTPGTLNVTISREWRARSMTSRRSGADADGSNASSNGGGACLTADSSISCGAPANAPASDGQSQQLPLFELTELDGSRLRYRAYFPESDSELDVIFTRRFGVVAGMTTSESPEEAAKAAAGKPLDCSVANLPFAYDSSVQGHIRIHGHTFCFNGEPRFRAYVESTWACLFPQPKRPDGAAAVELPAPAPAEAATSAAGGPAPASVDGSGSSTGSNSGSAEAAGVAAPPTQPPKPSSRSSAVAALDSLARAYPWKWMWAVMPGNPLVTAARAAADASAAAAAADAGTAAGAAAPSAPPLHAMQQQAASSASSPDCTVRSDASRIRADYRGRRGPWRHREVGVVMAHARMHIALGELPDASAVPQALRPLLARAGLADADALGLSSPAVAATGADATPHPQQQQQAAIAGAAGSGRPVQLGTAVSGTFIYVDVEGVGRIQGANVTALDRSDFPLPLLLSAGAAPGSGYGVLTPRADAPVEPRLDAGHLLEASLEQGDDAVFFDKHGAALLPLMQTAHLATARFEVSLSFASRTDDFTRLPVPYPQPQPAAAYAAQVRASASAAAAVPGANVSAIASEAEAALAAVRKAAASMATRRAAAAGRTNNTSSSAGRDVISISDPHRHDDANDGQGGLGFAADAEVEVMRMCSDFRASNSRVRITIWERLPLPGEAPRRWEGSGNHLAAAAAASGSGAHADVDGASLPDDDALVRSLLAHRQGDSPAASAGGYDLDEETEASAAAAVVQTCPSELRRSSPPPASATAPAPASESAPAEAAQASAPVLRQCRLLLDAPVLHNAVEFAFHAPYADVDAAPAPAPMPMPTPAASPASRETAASGSAAREPVPVPVYEVPGLLPPLYMGPQEAQEAQRAEEAQAAQIAALEPAEAAVASAGIADASAGVSDAAGEATPGRQADADVDADATASSAAAAVTAASTPAAVPLAAVAPASPSQTSPGIPAPVVNPSTAPLPTLLPLVAEAATATTIDSHSLPISASFAAQQAAEAAPAAARSTDDSQPASPHLTSVSASAVDATPSTDTSPEPAPAMHTSAEQPGSAAAAPPCDAECLMERRLAAFAEEIARMSS